ncbi:MAG: DUF2911 domain-containing protein [Flavobacteriales bacterium]|jgi:hypothetical protein|nr:DUF2911 domain-containing protein [Flavobacteriales bacterium]
MRVIVLFIPFLFVSLLSTGQEFKKLDKSPLDMAYFPANATKRLFVKTEEEKKALKPIARVLYSRPQKKDRVIFGNLVSYGETWRVGANESTEITFFVPVKFGDKKLKAGRYMLYAIPNKDTWEIKINAITDQWGIYANDVKKDIASVTVSTQEAKDVIEALSIVMYEKDANTFLIKIGWDKTIVEVPVHY